ncbi:uncharacterized protein LOC124816983 [Hydra vulgaris]|uniref:uncharacterized protein LOC124816983 n=1 Tax=Hydra vulgaris TaxID=6087 RepID=UPI001F5EDC08|nr:uncharacterized protein LOC124816983 [Hydra vulgaris]
MKKNGCRCDYLELAELTVMLLSGDVQYRLRKPGPDMKALWQIIRYYDVKPELAKPAIDSMKRHTWYIDPTAVLMALADEEVHDRDKIAKKLYSMSRPENYVVHRQQVDFELSKNLDFCQDNPPSLVSLINEQGGLIFHLLNQGRQSYSG